MKGAKPIWKFSISTTEYEVRSSYFSLKMAKMESIFQFSRRKVGNAFISHTSGKWNLSSFLFCVMRVIWKSITLGRTKRFPSFVALKHRICSITFRMEYNLYMHCDEILLVFVGQKLESRDLCFVVFCTS